MLCELRLHLRSRLVTSPTISILGSSTVFACSKENSFRFLFGDTYKSWLRCLIVYLQVGRFSGSWCNIAYIISFVYGFSSSKRGSRKGFFSPGMGPIFVDIWYAIQPRE